MTPNKFYYISSGEKNAMRTLRHVVSVPGSYYRDEYICNLARDFNEAVEKAREKIGTKAKLNASDFDLNEWGEDVGIKPWMRRQLQMIDSGIMPFGKHRGFEIEKLDDGYVKYWVEQTATNIVGQTLVQKFTDIANERGLFDKWEQEEKKREAKRQEKLEKMDYVGHVGRRMEIFIRCDKVLAFDGYYGVSYMNICLDRFGNRFVYRGTKKWEEGKYYSVKATIKEHKEYKGEKQNVISRPVVQKTIEKEAA